MQTVRVGSRSSLCVRSVRAARHITFLLVAMGVVAGATATHAAQSIEDFTKRQSQWKQMVGLKFRLEGRYSLFSSKLLKFQKCDLFFHAVTEFPRLTGRSRTVEVFGTLVENDGRLQFDVEQLRELPSDEQRYRAKLAQFRRPTSEQYLEVGAWAAGRARFYHDDALLEQANSANRQGIQVARSHLLPDDWKGLLALSRKARRLELSSEFWMEYVHQAYRMRWDDVRKPPANTDRVLDLLDQIVRDLPGSTNSIPEPSPNLRERYASEPFATYHEADVEHRRLLHRFFYSEIALSEIERQVADDFSNGYAIAAQIEARIPECGDLADSYRDRELRYRQSQLSTASRRQALELADQFRRRDQPERARSSLKLWLDSREARLRQEGPSGLIQLADDYIALLDSRAPAVILLKEAYANSPQVAENPAGERLSQLGYELHAGQWLTADEARSIPLDDNERAIREGRIETGMTGEEVRRALGQPQKIHRMAYYGHVTEVWVYGVSPNPQMAVHFTRRSKQPISESRVSALTDVSAF